MFSNKTTKRGDWVQDKKTQRLLAEMWGNYIDWGKRRKGESGWLLKQLKKHNCRKIFDSCLGDGCDSIYLIKEKFDVTSNDVDGILIQKALENAKKEKVQLNTSNFDWRELIGKIPEGSFDAVLCLGNSLTCLFGSKNQITALKNFYAILKKKGILIIDERNYQYILDNRKEVLKGNYRYSEKYLYCGKFVHSRPIEIKNNKIKYELYDKKGNKVFFTVYSFKRGELEKLLKQSGFTKIEKYSDYGPENNPAADFYFYICQK